MYAKLNPLDREICAQTDNGYSFEQVWTQNINCNALVFGQKIDLFQLWYFFFRHTLAMCSLLKVGRTIGSDYPTTWPPNIDFYPSNGWQKFGGRIPSSKMPRVWPSRLWPFPIIIFGFGKTKPFYIWSSKWHNPKGTYHCMDNRFIVHLVFYYMFK